MNLLNVYKNNEDVTINTHNGLHVIKYKSLAVNWENEYTRIARGIILNDNGEVVARPFDKFFNLNELAGKTSLSDELRALSMEDSGPIEVTDKLDGSLVITFYHDGLQFASSGSINSPHAHTFREASSRLWSKETYDKVEELSKTHTIIFEYTAPSNLIVIEYLEESLTVIGLRETTTGKEYSMRETKEIMKDFGLDYAETFEFSNVQEALNYTKVAHGVEGVVILFLDTMKRVKVKTEEYFNLHRSAKGFNMYGELTESNIQFITESVLNGDEGIVDDLLSRYRTREDMVEIVKKSDELITKVKNFVLDFEILKGNIDEALLEIEDMKYYDALKNPTYIKVGEFKFNSLLLVAVRKDIEAFHKKQKDYFTIRDTIKSTSYKKIIKLVNEEVGIISNYQNKISNKSFMYNVIDIHKIWNEINKSI